MIPVGFRQFSDKNKLKLAETIMSGRPALLRFLLIGPNVFATGYLGDCRTAQGDCPEQSGAWCLLRFPSGLRFSAFCPGGVEYGALLRDELCFRAEQMALDQWRDYGASLFGRAPCGYLVDRSLSRYFLGRKLLLPMCSSPTCVVVRQSMILRRFGTRYYHYISLSPCPME
jgi:hypothetical protein